MKKTLIALIPLMALLALTLLFVGCDTIYEVSWTFTPPKSGDVYVAGYVENNSGKSIATVWKNGTAISLGKGVAYSVYVSGNDVFVAGAVGDTAVVWKNGVATNLSSIGSGANSVYVSGNDVYVAGLVHILGVATAVVWKNGVATRLLEGEANSVFVSQGTVYVAGWAYKSGAILVATVWKNGTPTQFTDGSNASIATSVFVVK
jgi:hypothetical protein